MKRLALAWRTWRHGLPDVEVTHRFHRNTHDNGAAFTVTVDYEGKVHGIIDGDELWTNNGRFTIEQPITMSIERTRL